MASHWSKGGNILSLWRPIGWQQAYELLDNTERLSDIQLAAINKQLDRDMKAAYQTVRDRSKNKLAHVRKEELVKTMK
jgi:predicted amino acid racemase